MPGIERAGWAETDVGAVWYEEAGTPTYDDPTDEEAPVVPAVDEGPKTSD